MTFAAERIKHTTEYRHMASKRALKESGKTTVSLELDKTQLSHDIRRRENQAHGVLHTTEYRHMASRRALKESGKTTVSLKLDKSQPSHDVCC